MGCIYIAWDRNKENMSKVGMTTQMPHKRISQTENPDYELFKAYEIDDEELRYVEAELHNRISQKFTRKKHRSTGRFSEWFFCKPEKTLEIISDFLIEKLSNELKLYSVDSPKLGVKSSIESQNNLKEKIKARLLSRHDGTYESPYKKSSGVSQNKLKENGSQALSSSIPLIKKNNKQSELKEKLKTRLQSRKDGTYESPR
ncbi:GIY-YIG nuclease family protein [Shewanella surugensis]|uniref:GIY-YIG nuclease family protein n=1 Tax=Shewanella surugensis TaxID=212020 RepID=A0ABT0LDV0_9GAMM|nr:GIY-YIG nuclease family protein [Shewanella surugensis]MCL1125872.1 GIY-YIG nuclease family protein [Shewanella surugensis]